MEIATDNGEWCGRPRCAAWPARQRIRVRYVERACNACVCHVYDGSQSNWTREGGEGPAHGAALVIVIIWGRRYVLGLNGGQRGGGRQRQAAAGELRLGGFGEAARRTPPPTDATRRAAVQGGGRGRTLVAAGAHDKSDSCFVACTARTSTSSRRASSSCARADPSPSGSQSTRQSQRAAQIARAMAPSVSSGALSAARCFQLADSC